MHEHQDRSHAPSTEIPHITTRMEEIAPLGITLAGTSGEIVPNFLAPSVREIDFRYLHTKGIRYAALDVDRTLTPTSGNKLEDPALGEYIRGLQREGILEKVLLATRSGRNLFAIEEELNAEHFRHPDNLKKPDTHYFEGLLEQLHANPNEVVMVGDRLTHDIRGAAEVGMPTVLVEPIPKGWIKGWLPTPSDLKIYRDEKVARRKLDDVRERLKQMSTSH
ncbi:hypothetical protein BH09PAT1_BH09PAT1_7550 [soil metagenome]